MLCSLFCALTTLGAYIKLPLAVPVTLQLLFTNTAALLLGRKYGCVTVLLYIFCGLAGLPVFTTGAGLASFFSLTFGFTLGFIPGAFFAGMISDRSKSTKALALASAINLLCVYICGTLYFLLLKNLYFAQPTSISNALSVCVIPFIIPDAVKSAASILLIKKLRAHIR